MEIIVSASNLTIKMTESKMWALSLFPFWFFCYCLLTLFALWRHQQHEVASRSSVGDDLGVGVYALRQRMEWRISESIVFSGYRSTAWFCSVSSKQTCLVYHCLRGKLCKDSGLFTRKKQKDSLLELRNLGCRRCVCLDSNGNAGNYSVRESTISSV